MYVFIIIKCIATSGTYNQTIIYVPRRTQRKTKIKILPKTIISTKEN